MNGFVDKNNDLLFRDIKEVLSSSEDVLIAGMFPVAELESKKRPPTVRLPLFSLLLLLLLFFTVCVYTDLGLLVTMCTL